MKNPFVWMWRHKITSVFLLLVAGGLVIVLIPKKEKIEYVTHVISQGSARQTVSVTGNVLADESADLSFRVPGVVAKLSAVVDQEVKTGDVLAQLEAKELESSIQQARAQLAGAQANLSKVIEGAKSAEIKVAKTTVDNAQGDVDALLLSQKAEITKLEIALTDASIALDDAKRSTKQDIDSSFATLVSQLSTSYGVAQNVVANVRLVVTDFDITSVYSLFSSQAKFDTDLSYNQQKDQRVIVDPLLSGGITSSSVIGVYDEVLKYVGYVKKYASSAVTGVENTFLSGTYNQEKQQADIATTTGQKSIILNEESTLLSRKQAYESAVVAQTVSVNSAIQAYNQAKSALEVTKASHAVTLASAQAKLRSAKASYDLTISKASQSDILSSQAQVTAASANVSALVAQLDDYIVRSPFDGKVAKVYVKQNESVLSSAPIVTLLGVGQLSIEVDIPESDLPKIAIGNECEVTFDAYTQDKVVTGKVSSIDLAETLISDVVYYRVRITFEAGELQVQKGMTANVDIITAAKVDVVTIPQRAVLSETDGSLYVRVLKNEEVLKVVVTRGIRLDGGEVEITSGLVAGDVVILFEKEATK